MKEEIIQSLKEWRESIEEQALRNDDGEYLFSDSEKEDLELIIECMNILGGEF